MDAASTTSKRPIKENGYSSVKLHAKRDRKRHEAEVRQDEYQALSHKEKLARVQNRIFAGKGESKRELARLAITQ